MSGGAGHVGAPSIIQPSASRASAPAPKARTSGTPPSTVEVIVIITGRSRICAPTSIASRTPAPRSRNWLAKSTIRMPFLAMMPTRSSYPIWL
jgi:hypothetical protein